MNCIEFTMINFDHQKVPLKISKFYREQTITDNTQRCSVGHQSLIWVRKVEFQNIESLRPNSKWPNSTNGKKCHGGKIIEEKKMHGKKWHGKKLPGKQRYLSKSILFIVVSFKRNPTLFNSHCKILKTIAKGFFFLISLFIKKKVTELKRYLTFSKLKELLHPRNNPVDSYGSAHKK